MPERSKTLFVEHPSELWTVENRRQFLKLLGIGGTIVMLPAVFAACDDDDDNGGGPGPVSLNLSNDAGILNYAYALEQLEAAFYIAAVSSGRVTVAAEQEILTDIRNHEVIHREFLKAALAGAAIPDLQVSFGTALDSRNNILTTARTFEDLGVSAYNGAGKYLTSVTNLLVAGKIVSVEARHAAVIRDVLGTTGREFAGDDVVNAQGLDVVNEPAAVLTAADPFIETTVTIGTQPTP
ncbi:MAG: ferritin-like domain-containing protein [Gemmatimonadaceae bacterium]